MDIELIILRVVHVGAAMMWFGGAIIASFFLDPTVKALGQTGQPFMNHLMQRRRMGIFFPVVAGLTVLSGVALYWRDSGGLQIAWITSLSGLTFTVGGHRGVHRRHAADRSQRGRAVRRGEGAGLR